MTSHLQSHPTDETLLRLVDGDLEAADSRELETHLTGCEDCRERLALLRESLERYLRFHKTVLKPGLPPPPKKWASLDFSIGLAPKVSKAPIPISTRRFPARRWLAAAAAVVIAFLLVRRFEHTPEVKAAELLHKAAVAERERPETARRIRIKTRKRTWDRRAHLTTADARVSTPDSLDVAQTKQMFEAAGYSWEDPLSVQSFDRWRQHLSDRRDEVTALPPTGNPQSYIVKTTTTAGPLSSAALTLRTKDLRAVACTLLFGFDETIDITELPDEAAEPQNVEPSAAAAPPSAPAVASTPNAGPAEELHVIAALHRIGADLGEPIGVKLDGSHVLVSVGDLSVKRREQVRVAIADIRGVKLQLENIPGHDTRAELPPPHNAPQQGSANPLIAELQAVIGGDVSTSSLSDQFIDATEPTIERVYALRALVRRFPPDIDRQLPAPDREVLHRIVQDHITAIANSTLAIRRLLAPILPEAGAAASSNPTDAGTTWQDSASAMLPRARQIDHAVNGGSSGQSGTASQKSQLAQALAELESLIAAVRGALQL